MHITMLSLNGRFFGAAISTRFRDGIVTQDQHDPVIAVVNRLSICFRLRLDASVGYIVS